MLKNILLLNINQPSYIVINFNRNGKSFFIFLLFSLFHTFIHGKSRYSCQILHFGITAF
ncbi:hypothetical protein CLOSTASPAR_02114 [[Clostridium] asparagiforme DSM 15981]|uniref:Uncharacterized protein n=1 Tax=[Clostridium] asparagiforme DSM 15981 TaxID=518636 RepID=C0CYN7_9FIRM|nr:hypothetical protein CLOSTASPAR_02114 [[Clostridium] asparagiforme DSM 15981]